MLTAFALKRFVRQELVVKYLLARICVENDVGQSEDVCLQNSKKRLHNPPLKLTIARPECGSRDW
jgi:hypothetical protein